MAETPVFDALADALGADRPIALATVVEGTGIGAKLLVEPGRTVVGTLGNADLDRVVVVPAPGEPAKTPFW